MPGTDPDHPLLGVYLRLAHQHWSQAVHGALVQAGFGDLRSHHASVFTFTPPEGIQVSALANLAHVRKQTMAQTVEELERLGYVERRPDPADRRARLVLLTERGRSVRPVTTAAGRRVMERWSEVMDPGSLAELERLLGELLTALGSGHRAAGNAAARPPDPAGYARSNRSRFMTLSHAATKSRTNFSSASALA